MRSTIPPVEAINRLKARLNVSRGDNILDKLAEIEEQIKLVKEEFHANKEHRPTVEELSYMLEKKDELLVARGEELTEARKKLREAAELRAAQAKLVQEREVLAKEVLRLQEILKVNAKDGLTIVEHDEDGNLSLTDEAGALTLETEEGEIFEGLKPTTKEPNLLKDAGLELLAYSGILILFLYILNLAIGAINA